MFTIGLFNKQHHSGLDFREQISVLYPLSPQNEEGYIRVIRSWLYVCQPGRAGFDPDRPGVVDSFAGWQEIDRMIEKEGVIGICHTHPEGIPEFSGEDRRAQIGLAKANGKKFLWHVLQVANSQSARIIAMNMFTPGHVMTHDFGTVELDVQEPIIHLPCPIRIESSGSGLSHSMIY